MAIAGYQIRRDGGAWEDIAWSQAGQSVSFTYTGLTENTIYDFEVRSFDNSSPVKYSPPSRIKQVRTLPGYTVLVNPTGQPLLNVEDELYTLS
jgi:hypothetical protein